jgi:hypothetical protein
VLLLCELGRRLGGEGSACGMKEREKGEGGEIPIIPPTAQAAKYFPLYSSIFGFGRAFSIFDILAAILGI